MFGHPLEFFGNSPEQVKAQTNNDEYLVYDEEEKLIQPNEHDKSKIANPSYNTSE